MNMKINQEKLKEAPSKGIELIVLFGSQAEKREHLNSDYDIAVLTVPDKNIKDFNNYSDILLFLREALEIQDYKLDLTNINEANSLLLHNIFSKGKLIYGDRNAFDEYRAFSFREYLDARPLFQLEYHLIQKRQIFFKQIIQNQC